MRFRQWLYSTHWRFEICIVLGHTLRCFIRFRATFLRSEFHTLFPDHFEITAGKDFFFIVDSIFSLSMSAAQAVTKHVLNHKLESSVFNPLVVHSDCLVSTVLSISTPFSYNFFASITGVQKLPANVLRVLIKQNS